MRRGLGADGGFATAEVAVALPALVLLLAAALTAVSAVSAQLRCVDAAREAVRAGARGDADAVAAGRRVAPAGASVSVVDEGPMVSSVVSVQVRLAGAFPAPITVGATATASREPGGPG